MDRLPSSVQAVDYSSPVFCLSSGLNAVSVASCVAKSKIFPARHLFAHDVEVMLMVSC